MFTFGNIHSEVEAQRGLQGCWCILIWVQTPVTVLGEECIEPYDPVVRFSRYYGIAPRVISATICSFFFISLATAVFKFGMEKKQNIFHVFSSLSRKIFQSKQTKLNFLLQITWSCLFLLFSVQYKMLFRCPIWQIIIIIIIALLEDPYKVL